MPKLTTAQREEMKAAIHRGDLYKDIAARYGINENTVSHHARKLGYGRRNSTRRLVLPQILPERLTELLDSDPVPLRGTPAWMEDGACRGIPNPDVMYPVGERDAPPARAVCKPCPVKQTCLEWALATREPHGVWGGLTEADRIQLLDNRGADTTQQEAPAC